MEGGVTTHSALPFLGPACVFGFAFLHLTTFFRSCLTQVTPPVLVSSSSASVPLISKKLLELVLCVAPLCCHGRAARIVTGLHWEGHPK